MLFAFKLLPLGFQGVAHAAHNRVEVERLHQVVRRSLLHRLNALVNIAIGGGDQKHQMRVPVTCSLQKRQAGDSSHPEVGNDHIEGFLLERFESVLAVRAGLAIETLSGQDFAEQLRARRVVINEENARPLKACLHVDLYFN